MAFVYLAPAQSATGASAWAGNKSLHCLCRVIGMGGITDTGLSEGVQQGQGENDDTIARTAFDEEVKEVTIPIRWRWRPGEKDWYHMDWASHPR